MSNTIEISLHGVPGVRKAFRQLTRAGLLAAGRGLYMEGEIIMGESKMPHNVPVDTAVLQSSGHVNPPELVGGTGIRVTLGYGGAASAYAQKQHEDLSLKHPSGGRPKYLEIPAMERAAYLGKTVALEMAKAFQRTAKQTRNPRLVK